MNVIPFPQAVSSDTSLSCGTSAGGSAESSPDDAPRGFYSVSTEARTPTSQTPASVEGAGGGRLPAAPGAAMAIIAARTVIQDVFASDDARDLAARVLNASDMPDREMVALYCSGVLDMTPEERAERDRITVEDGIACARPDQIVKALLKREDIDPEKLGRQMIAAGRRRRLGTAFATAFAAAALPVFLAAAGMVIAPLTTKAIVVGLTTAAEADAGRAAW